MTASMKSYIAAASIAGLVWVGALHAQSVKPYVAEGPTEAKTGHQKLPDASAVVIKHLYQRAKRLVLESADAMPEQDYTFRPTPKVMSFGEMVAHVAFVQIGDCAAAQGDTRLSPIDLTKSAKKDAIALLKSSFDYCNPLYDTLTNVNGAALVGVGAGRRTRVDALADNVADNLFLHYGNFITYLRLKGLTPPSSPGK
jgi:hypothetical protein